MTRPDLPPRLIQSFLAVLRMQSFTEAARALNLTQPAVTQHIARLEEILGLGLMERRRGVVIPTPAGLALVPDFERFEQSLDMVFRRARAAAETGRETVQIAATTSLISYLLAPVLAGVQAEGAAILPVFREVDDFRVYDMVRAGEVDFALTSMSGSDAEMSQTVLLRDRACLVMPVAHPLAGNREIPLEALRPHALIRPPVETAAMRMFEACQQTIGQEFDIAAEATRLMTLAELVRAGIGLVILPGLSARLVSGCGLVSRPLAIEGCHRICQLVRSQHKPLTPAARRIAAVVREVAAGLRREMADILA